MANANLIKLDMDPAKLSFPPSLPVEIAMREQSVKEVCQNYDISRQEWDVIRVNPVFVRALRDAVDLLQKEGMGFKIKARLQSEELLKTSWALIHSSNADVPPAVKADLIKRTWQVAGLDGSIDQKGAAAAAVATGNTLMINVNLR
jgi:hypothetical protein